MFYKDLPELPVLQFMLLHASIYKHMCVNYRIFFMALNTFLQLYTAVYTCPIDKNAPVFRSVRTNSWLQTLCFFSLCERGFKLAIDGSNLRWFSKDWPRFNLSMDRQVVLNWSIRFYCMWFLQTAIAAIFFTSTHGCKNKNCIIYSLL